LNARNSLGAPVPFGVCSHSFFNQNACIVPGETRDLPILLSAAGASTGQRRAAFIVSLIVFAGFITTVPIAQVNLARFPGIILIQNTLAFVNDALTACLLFAQYAVSRSRALCALAFGYLFTALMAVSHALSFPEVFSPTGLLEGTPWLYVAWHAVLPVAIILFALRRPDQESPGSTRNALIPIAVTSLGAVCLALASTWIITKGETWLPALVQAGRLMPASKVVVAVLLLMSLAALLMLLAPQKPVNAGCLVNRRDVNLALHDLTCVIRKRRAL
jgi:two-component system, sensor histidine kinase and response regulator